VSAWNSITSKPCNANDAHCDQDVEGDIEESGTDLGSEECQVEEELVWDKNPRLAIH
jgi:hypothetical protein